VAQLTEGIGIGNCNLKIPEGGWCTLTVLQGYAADDASLLTVHCVNHQYSTFPTAHKNAPAPYDAAAYCPPISVAQLPYGIGIGTCTLPIPYNGYCTLTTLAGYYVADPKTLDVYCYNGQYSTFPTPTTTPPEGQSWYCPNGQGGCPPISVAQLPVGIGIGNCNLPIPAYGWCTLTVLAGYWLDDYQSLVVYCQNGQFTTFPVPHAGAPPAGPPPPEGTPAPFPGPSCPPVSVAQLPQGIGIGNCNLPIPAGGSCTLNVLATWVVDNQASLKVTCTNGQYSTFPTAHH
jgi:hypothetical protein